MIPLAHPARPVGAKFGRALLLFAAYFALACVITYPLIAQLGTHLAGFVYGDGREMAHHLWWARYALEHGQPLFTQTLLGYPNGIDGVTLWADPLQFVPGWLLTFLVPLPLAYNLPLLLNMALNGSAMAALAGYLLRPAAASNSPNAAPRFHASASWAAVIAGVVFMLYPVMLGHLGAGHSGLMAQWPLPLYALALLRLRERVTLGRILIAAACFVLGAWGHTLQVIYALLPVTAIFFLWALAAPPVQGGQGAGRWRWAAAVMASAVLGALALGLFLLPVLATTLGTAAYTDAGGTVRYSADLLAIVSPSFRHPLWGSLLDYPRRVLGVNIDEGAAYLGLITAALAAIAVWRVRAARVWLLLGLLAYGLALGPLLKVFDQPVQVHIDNYESLVTLPFALLTMLPGLSLARSPGRFNFMLALAAAALAAYGAAWLLARIGSKAARAGVALVLCGLIAFDTLTFWPLPTTDAAIPAAISALRERDDIRAVFDAPWDSLIAAKDALYLQTAHEHALIAGQVTRATPVNPAKLDLLETFDPALLALAGADVVIVHRDDADEALEARARARLGDPFYEDAQYALFDTPDSPPPAAPQVRVWEQGAALPVHTDVFSPERGWLRVQGQLAGQTRASTLTWNGEVVQRLPRQGAFGYDAALPLEAGGFQRAQFAPDVACPVLIAPGAECSAPVMAESSFEVITETGAPFTPVTFERGVALPRAYAERTEAGFTVYLYWQFTQPRTEQEVRYVHVLNAAGELVAQQDSTLGAQQAGDSYGEVITLGAELPVGEYRIFTGWYAFPDQARFCVLGEGGVCTSASEVAVSSGGA